MFVSALLLFFDIKLGFPRGKSIITIAMPVKIPCGKSVNLIGFN